MDGGLRRGGPGGQTVSTLIDLAARHWFKAALLAILALLAASWAARGASIRLLEAELDVANARLETADARLLTRDATVRAVSAESVAAQERAKAAIAEAQLRGRRYDDLRGRLEESAARVRLQDPTCALSPEAAEAWSALS